MKRDRAVQYCDLGIELSLNLLIFILPFRHAATIRGFCILFPLLLWIIKMFLQKRLLFSRTPLDLPIVAFFLWGLTSIVTATDFRYSLDEIRGEMGTYFLLFYLIANNLQDEERMKGMIKILMLGVFTLSFYGVMEFLQRENRSLTDVIKINSLTVDLGVYLVLTVPVIFILHGLSNSIKEKVFISIVILVSLFALYLTHNRAAWVAFIVQVILLAGIKRKWKTLSAIILIVVTLIVIVTLTSFKDILIHRVPVLSTTGEMVDRETAQSRLVIWKEGIDKIKAHPFTGIGYGRESFKKAFPDNPVMLGDKGLWHSHNIFIEIALEIGVPGLIIFLWLLYSLTRTIIKGMKTTGFGKVLMTSLFIVLIGFLIRNQFDHIYIDDTALMFWFLMGMGMAIMLKGKSMELREKRIG
ncbi:MAG: O-antigen ligase family protein [Nitrospirae bacterium]|nr:O-antigen ligase family protein [Nitrospirota bacterium]